MQKCKIISDFAQTFGSAYSIKNYNFKMFLTFIALNDEDFGGALSDAIEFFNSTREFFVVVNGLLNATLRNEYTFQVKVSIIMQTFKINMTPDSSYSK